MRFNLFFILLLAFVLFSCGGQNQKTEEQPYMQDRQELPQATKINPLENHPGKKVYDSVCLICHMADASGVPGMFPPLIQTEWVTGDKERLIKITLEGMSGEIEVNGEVYNNIMPPNSHLSDKQIADVLTYIRQSFGNVASEVTIEEVQKVRNN